VAYTQSIPLRGWMDPRRDAINTLAMAHAAMGEVDGPGRPREFGRPVAHAYVLRVVAEFQAFVRDLHDLAAERMISLAEPKAQFRPLLIAAATEGRLIDRGNADVRSVEQDFRRLGIGGLTGRLQASGGRWAPSSGGGDRAMYQNLIELRNALAHGNQGQLDRLRARGVADTVTWTRGRLPALNRTARALDRVVWDHLRGTFRRDPW
jgi:hypothetical protein